MPGAPLEIRSKDTPCAATRLLDADAVGHVVGRDQVEGPVGEAGPQRVLVARRAERRRDDEAGAVDRVRLLVSLRRQGEVVRAGLGGRVDAGSLRPRTAVERVGRDRWTTWTGASVAARTPSRGWSRRASA